MKKILFSCLLVFLFSDVFATHIIGGEMRYLYMGPGVAPNSKLYRIRILLMKGDSPLGAALASQYIIGIFNNDNGIKVNGPAVNNNWAAVEDFVTPLPVPIIISPCIQPPPVLPYIYKTYSFVVELPDNQNGYTLAFQTYSRQDSRNIVNNQGATYTCVIPGLNVLPNPQTDNSPAYKLPISAICENSPFTLDFSATDPEGDSLVYNFCDAYNGGLASNAAFDDPAPPPYGSVNYIAPYTGSSPMGSQVTINSSTGIISGIAPVAGKYVICVCASVYRNGVLITVHRKDLIVAVNACVPLTANPNFTPITCDGFTVNFQDNSAGNPDSWLWDFGDPASGVNNTSTSPNPVHTFSDTGVFNVKLVVSIFGQCTDSIIKQIRVYPGFLPGFLNTAPCVNTPIQFTDTTYFQYGNVIAWRWDFGDAPPGDPGDTSHLQNPVYSYTSTGPHTVELIVTNDKGCTKTYTKQIIVNDNPLVSVFPKDSIYCGLDTLQLNGVGTGTFNWTPPINIIGANTATPQVFPPAITWYHTTLTDANGCKSRDSLKVIPKFDLSNAIAGPITICEEDTVVLRGTSNYSNNITWQWSPAATVESPVNDTTRVYPIVNTTYTLRTRWGNNCIATKTHTINVRPLAIPNAGPDAFVCTGGQTSTQLNASGGNSYSWTPTTGLSNPNIPNPIASPTVPTNYVVAVGVTGCPKLRTDTVFVNVGALPPITMLNDTLICTIDTLQLTTGGTGTFVWTPNYMISSTTAQSPLVSPNVPTWYYVTLTDAVGCKSRDSVFVDVKASVSLNAGADTTICQTDGFLLNTVSDGLYYQWTPATYLNNSNIKNPFATPLTTTTYRVRASIGKCYSEDDISIKVVPYPAANAGPDAFICTGLSVQLNATGGSSYAWSPATFLNNRLIPNPVSIRPGASIQYIVTVRDTLGCPKPVKDTVWVRVYPAVVADAGPRDTTVVSSQPLFLNASGGATYVWSPSTWLNNANIQNPVSLPQDDILYILTATTAEGCVGTDSILVHLFKMDEDIYVPNAFTPNGDGNNDVLRPILLGMKELTYFRVYNRWGVLMFSTTEQGKGWDGRYGGKAQDPAAFVWECEAVTYKGQIRKRKGSAILIH